MIYYYIQELTSITILNFICPLIQTTVSLSENYFRSFTSLKVQTLFLPCVLAA